LDFDRRIHLKKIAVILVLLTAGSMMGFLQDIFKPVIDGDLEKVKVLISKDSGWVHKRDQAGKTAVHIAAEKGYLDILTLLLDHGGLKDKGNENQITPLHYACYNNHLDCVKLLVERGAGVNKANNQSLSAISFAVLKDNLEVARFLLLNGAKVDCLDREAGTLLHSAARNGNSIFFAAQGGNRDILIMLASKGADFKKPDRYGKTPLYNALVKGHVDAALWLINQKLSLKRFKTMDGSTYLHAAAESRVFELVKLILSRGVKDNAKNLYGETPYSIANQYKNKKIISLLKAHGIEKSRQHSTGRGPYLGQKLPGTKPVIFAPGLVTNRNTTDRDICFTSDLKTLYFTKDWKIKEIKQGEKGWIEPKNLFSGKYLEAEGFLSPDEKKIFFISRRPVGQSAGPESWEIWTSLKTAAGWNTPQLLGDPFKGCYYTTFTRDYVMYYTGKGNDIYYSRFLKGSFGKPVKLSNAVNTAKDEYNSFIAPDETYLIFSSMGLKDHYGGGDLYISFRKENGAWSKAVNMGPAVNTSSHEYCPSVSPDGKYIFFSSNKLGNKDDVYWMDAIILKQLKLIIKKAR